MTEEYWCYEETEAQEFTFQDLGLCPWGPVCSCKQLWTKPFRVTGFRMVMLPSASPSQMVRREIRLSVWQPLGFDERILSGTWGRRDRMWPGRYGGRGDGTGMCVQRSCSVCVQSLAGATFPCVCIVLWPFTIIHSRAVWWEISPACLTSLCISLYRNLFLGFMEL